MRSDWEVMPLRRVARLQKGVSYSGEYLDQPGVRLLGLGTIVPGGGIRISEARSYSGAVKAKQRIKPGELLVALTDLTQDGLILGSPARLPDDAAGEFAVTHHVARVEISEKERLDARFLYYVLMSRAFREYMRGVATGTTVRAVSPADAEAFDVALPSFREQRRIAGVLGALDDKIEHNRARSARLLELARLKFERWFRSAAEAPRVRVTELISSARLVVNDGYRAKNSEMAAEGVPFLRGGNVNDDLELKGADLLGHDGVARAGDKVSRVGDAFFTAKGTVGRIGRVSRWTPRFVYSPQIAFWRSLDEDALAPEYLYLWLGSRDFIGQRDAVKGQTDMADYVNLRDQRAMAIVVAGPEQQRELTSVVRPLLDSEALARAESRRLSAIRDALLPRLVSGRMRVPESYDPDDVLGTLAEQAAAS